MNHYHRAWYLALFGRLDEAIREHERPRDLDPFTPLHTAWLGTLYAAAGRYDDGIAEAAKALQMDPQDPMALIAQIGIFGPPGVTTRRSGPPRHSPEGD